jgi:hypothetical protein
MPEAVAARKRDYATLQRDLRSGSDLLGAAPYTSVVIRVAGGVLRERSLRTMPSMMVMQMPGMPPSARAPAALRRRSAGLYP